ncbi:MGDG synthase family glycosyltransferase [Massilia glaciei]|uniref:Galactosyldiacylglycerol synthase n=1 Tax=Massilia glaciei TaxID=1524097 RepID=A0A2U2HPH3_9BURK|nr:glycosyltransferase [Massilia glaciei]PWF49326.1 galactosyldiacylglycerol synthase [Massilia glaciei]
MTRTTILLLSVSAGTGHTRAAEALRAQAGGAGDVEVIHLDLLNFVSPLLRLVYADLYCTLTKVMPTVWRALYHLTDNAQPGGLGHRMRRWAERANSRQLLYEIEQLAPDLIVCTHFLPAELLSHLLASGAVRCPVWVQVTDFDLHRMWVHEHMAGYFAPNDEVAFRMRGYGIAADAIHVTGIPIMPAFSIPAQRDKLARELGLQPEVSTIILMGAGNGFGNVAELARHILCTWDHVQLIVLGGRDQQTLAELHALAASHPGRLKPIGYTKEIERLMACADMIVTKPGGLITSESLAMGLPMILIAPIPGQEEHNANYLLEQGVALQASNLATLTYRIGNLLAHPEKLAGMRNRALPLGRPGAAGQVLDTVFTHLEKQQCRLHIQSSSSLL